MAPIYREKISADGPHGVAVARVYIQLSNIYDCRKNLGGLEKIRLSRVLDNCAWIHVVIGVHGSWLFHEDNAC